MDKKLRRCALQFLAPNVGVTCHKGGSVKKVLKVIGIIFLCIIALFGAIATYTYMKSAQYEKTAVPYIKEKIPELSSWDPNVAKKYFAPEVLEITKDEDLIRLMRWFSKLGALKGIEEPQFINVSSSATVSNGQQTIASYTILAHYENGDANITIRLLEVENGFKIYQFHISSMALIN